MQPSGIDNTEQGLAAGLQGTSLQTGGGLWLAITAAVVTASTTSAQGVGQRMTPSIVAQLSGFHVGLFVAAGGVAAGALIALIGIAGHTSGQPEQHLSPGALIEDKLPL